MNPTGKYGHHQHVCATTVGSEPSQAASCTEKNEREREVLTTNKSVIFMGYRERESDIVLVFYINTGKYNAGLLVS